MLLVDATRSRRPQASVTPVFARGAPVGGKLGALIDRCSDDWPTPQTGTRVQELRLSDRSPWQCLVRQEPTEHVLGDPGDAVVVAVVR